MIAFKSRSLTTVDVSKTQLKESLNNILEDLKTNKKDFIDQQNKRRGLKRIKKLKNFIDKIDSTEKEEIEEKINKPSWLVSLLEDQLINQEDIISPRRNKKIISKITKRKLSYENVIIRKKRQLEANTSKKRLKELPEIYTEIPADQTGKIKTAEKTFNKILKQVSSTPQKMVNVTLKKQMAGILKKNGCRWKNKRVQNLFRSLQNDPKNAFCTANKITKSLLKKQIMGPYNKIMFC